VTVSFYFPTSNESCLCCTSLPTFGAVSLLSYCWVLKILFILWITVLYQICLLQIFSLLVCVIFTFSWHCFSHGRNFNFNEVCLVNHFFTDHGFGVVSEMSSPYVRQSRISSMLSSKSFIVLYFTFWSMIYFELAFVKGVRFFF
jgi:hypothetical protein